MPANRSEPLRPRQEHPHASRPRGVEARLHPWRTRRSARLRPRPDAVPRASKRSSVEAEIARLPGLGLTELRQRWVDLYGMPAPKYSRRGLLVRAVAHHIR